METLPRHSTDFTDDQWGRVSHPMPPPQRRGRPVKYERRDVANAVMFVQRNRCSWRSLPGGLPPWRIVYWYFSQWRTNGVLDRLIAEVSVGACHQSQDADRAQAEENGRGVQARGGPRAPAPADHNDPYRDWLEPGG
jgi:transposase